MTTKNKIWYGIYGKKYEGADPCFYEGEQFEWVHTIESNWKTILDELAPLMNESNDKMLPYFNNDLQSANTNWRTFGLYFWSKKIVPHCKRFPQTTAIFESIPAVVTVSLNVIEPHSKILPHHGDTNAIIRCHLGLKIPAGLPDCGFTVGGQTRAWKEGKVLLFCDAHQHEAFNNTNERRYVLLFDVIKNEHMGNRLNICSRVLGALSMDFVAQHFRFIYKLPLRLLIIFLRMTSLIWRIYLPLQKKFGFDFLSLNKL